MKRVVVTDTVFSDLAPLLKIMEGVATVETATSRDQVALRDQLRTADAVVNTYAPLGGEVIAAMENCRIIARSGIGVDTIDVAAATAKNIKVTNVPDYCIDEVADHAMALALALVRKLNAARIQTALGVWDLAELKPIKRLKGRVLGLLGYGKIARTLAKRAEAFQIKVIYYDPNVAAAEQGATALPSVEALFEAADIISLHAPLTTQTRHIVNRDALRRMKRDAILVNTSRGGLIDTDALLAALRAGEIGGVGLDVLEREDGDSASRFGDFDNVIVTPHAGFYSEQSMLELQVKCATDVRRVLTGDEPIYWINRPK